MSNTWTAHLSGIWRRNTWQIFADITEELAARICRVYAGEKETMKRQAASSSESSATKYQLTRCRSPADLRLYQHSFDGLNLLNIQHIIFYRGHPVVLNELQEHYTRYQLQSSTIYLVTLVLMATCFGPSNYHLAILQVLHVPKLNGQMMVRRTKIYSD